MYINLWQSEKWWINERLDDNAFLTLIPWGTAASSYCMHTLDNLQLELTPTQPVRSDKDQQGNYLKCLCLYSCCPQVIQTISAVDKDEPLSGHRFYFALAAPAAGNLNFTLRDNKGVKLVYVIFLIIRSGYLQPPQKSTRFLPWSNMGSNIDCKMFICMQDFGET